MPSPALPTSSSRVLRAACRLLADAATVSDDDLAAGGVAASTYIQHKYGAPVHMELMITAGGTSSARCVAAACLHAAQCTLYLWSLFTQLQHSPDLSTKGLLRCIRITSMLVPSGVTIINHQPVLCRALITCGGACAQAPWTSGCWCST
jgi:hypothetical protein